MQIVIDIPEKYKDLLDKGEADGSIRKSILLAVSNGTPLPKSHGDLKDADKLKHAFIKRSMAVQGSFTDADIAYVVCNSPTIIEADMAESEEV